MSCPKCKSFDLQTHKSENHVLNMCNVCEHIFGDFQTTGYCCEFKNIKVVQFELENGSFRKANCCINCLKNFSNVKKETPHFMFVSYSERQKIRESIRAEFDKLYSSVRDTKKHYKQRYYEYLRSDEWKKKRLERLKIDNFTCQSCGNKSGRLDVHHTTYDTLYNESIYDIITLCNQCHFKLHEND
jgi:hypothetical protein